MIPPFSDPFQEISKSGGASKGQSRKEIRTGQALNVVAGAGGLNAVRMAVKEAKGVKYIPNWHGAVNPNSKLTRLSEKKGFKVLKPIAQRPKTAAAIGVGGMLGLHTAELTGDAIAARSLHIAHKNAKK